MVRAGADRRGAAVSEERLRRGEWEVGKIAEHRDIVRLMESWHYSKGAPNAASFLLGRSMRLIDRARWPVLLTYADTAHGHTGAIYLATNWECLGETKAGDTWVDPDGRQVGRKRGAFSYTRADAERMGWRRMPSMPKIKFVHRCAAPARRPSEGQLTLGLSA